MESYSVQAVLSAVDKNLSSTFGKAAQAASDFESKSKQSLENVGKFMTVAGAAVTAIGIKSVKSFGDFQSSLNKAAVIAGGTSKDIQGLADVANHMGAVLPISAQDAADAMVAMARDGASISTIKKEFPAIAEAATAAGADLQTTASVVQQSMNIWGDSLKSPQRAAAILTQTANLSNASIEDMQQALATIGGTASNAGIDMATTSTAIGLLTNKGFSAAQASQDLNHALLLMQAPSKMGKAVMDDLGVSMTDAQGNMKPLPTILNELSDSMSNMTSSEKAAALKKMFGTSGMAAILPLMKSVKDTTGNATTSWSAFTDQMNKASSSTQTATKFLQDQATEMQKNLGSSIEQVGGNWEALRNAAMAGSAGVIGSIIDMINNALEWATTTKSAFGNSIRTIMGLTPVIGAATLATGTFLTAATKIGSVMSTVGTALKALFISPIGLAIVAISALIAAFAYAYKTSAFFRKTISDIGNSISQAFGPVLKNAINYIKNFVGQGIGLFSNFGNKVADLLQGIMVKVNFSSIAIALSNTFNQVMNVVVILKNAVVDLISGFMKTGAVKSSWLAIISVVGAVYSVVQSVITAVGNLLGSFYQTKNATSIFETIGTVIGKIVTVIANVITYVANLVSAILSIKGASDVLVSIAVGVGGIALGFKVIATAVKVAQTAMAVFSAGVKIARGAMMAFNVAINANPISLLVIAITAVVAALVYFFTQTATGKKMWSDFVKFIVDKWNGLVSAIKSVGSSIVGAWNSTVSSVKNIWKSIPGFFSGIWSQITADVSSTGQGVADVWNSAVNYVMGIWSNIVTFFSALWSGIISTLQPLFTALTDGWNNAKANLSGIWNGIITIAGSVWNLLKDVIMGPILLVLDLIMGDFTQLGIDAANIWNNIVSSLGSIWTGLVQIASTTFNIAMTAIINIWNTVSTTTVSIWDSIVSTVTGIWNSFVSGSLKFATDLFNGVINIWNAIPGWASGLWNTVKSNVSNTWNGMVSGGSSFANNTFNSIKGVWNSIPGWASSLWNSVKNVTHNVWSGIYSGTYNMAVALVRGVRGAWSGITGWASNVWNGVKSVIRGAMNFDLGAAGRAIMDSFFSGLVSAWGKVKSFVGGIASWIRKHKGPISYDRKLLIPAGNAIMTGLNAGLVDNFKTVQKNVSGMAGSILDAATSIGNLATNAIGDPINALNNNIGGSYSSVMTLDHTSTPQPANITIGFDKNGYTAYVDDINNQQGKTALLKRNNSVQL
ncbi:phage tail tape measure protein [Leuconostoc mesenteroides]|uniref:phage tail tape measure protein n=1 Tax=Leuconostoc mesenteroides TaxID=1245 RepID=UPI002361031B|nr:phage tail tape measure protein [Leuconostoc mesenteroides]